MKRYLSVTVIMLLVFGLSACGGEKKPPQPAAYLGKKILAAVSDLEHTYAKKDLGGFMAVIAKEYADREAFERAVKRTFSKYDTIHFSVQSTKMLIMVPDRGNIKAAVNWDGEWRTTRGDFLKDGGRVTLVFDPGSFRLLSIDGKNPFVPVEKQGK